MNYDKGHLEEDAGINYALEEYANAVVFTVKEVCDANEVPTPTLVTESGRALTAHHSVLIVPVLGAHAKDDPSQDLTVPGGRGRAAARAEQDPHGAAEDAQAIGAARGLPRHQRAARRSAPAVHARLPAARGARARREPLLAHLHGLAEGAEAQQSRLLAARDHRARGQAHRALPLRFLGVPVDARPLGHRPAVPDRADRPARRAPGEARSARRSHLRLGRQGHALRVDARQPVPAGAPDRRTARRTTWASS